MDLTPPHVPAREVVHDDGSVSFVVDVCPYCQQRHTHGESLGHRHSHCTDSPGRHPKVDPRDCQDTLGYFLCDPSDSIDWQHEFLIGQLTVAQNKRRRILTEADGMIPYSARDQRVQTGLREEAQQIEAVLKAAGVEL